MKLKLVFAFVFTLAGLTHATFPSAYAGEGCLDVPKYTGGWYQIATTKYVSDTMEYGCTCPQLYYKLNETNSDNVDGTYACLQSGNTVKYNVQLRRPNPKQYPSQFQLYMPATMPDWPSNVNYVVLKTWRDENGNLSYVLIGLDNPNAFWLIARSPRMDNGIIQNAIQTAYSQGYNTTSLHVDDQNKCLHLLQ